MSRATFFVVMTAVVPMNTVILVPPAVQLEDGLRSPLHLTPGVDQLPEAAAL